MKINNLTIFKNKVPIRTVQFKDGLNIITNIKGVGRTGNSVGKSTLARVIDFLFLASIEPIYIDDEFKNPNKQIEFFFQDNDVEVELSFIGIDNKLHKISRNLTTNKESYKYIVDTFSLSKNEYEKQLQLLFFDISTKRPSIRSLAPKFIRNDSHKMLNTIKFLNKYSRGGDYSELFLYLFGFEDTNLLTKKKEATSLVARRQRNSTSLNAIVKEQKPLKLINDLKENIKSLEEKFLKFDYSSNLKDPIISLTKLQKSEDLISDNILKNERKILNIKKTIQILSNKGGNLLSNELKQIYEFAGVSIESGTRKYDEVLAFHDNLVAKKRQYLKTDLPSLGKKKNILTKKLDNIYSQKRNIFSNMQSKMHINKITEDIKKLGQLKIDLGKIEGIVEQKEKALYDLDEAKKVLDNILQTINKELNNIEDIERYFNEKFKQISKLVLDDDYKFGLNFDKEKGNCKLEIINRIPNPEGGKKKSEVIAFDLAYIHAVNEFNLSKPTFVIHDSIEDIDPKQIDILFEQSRLLPGQQIISLLSENLSRKIYDKYAKDVILYLSDKEKFFNV